MANLTLILERERRMNERNRLQSERRARPIFRKAQYEQVKLVYQWLDVHGAANVPVESLIIRGVWRDTYRKAYELIGMTQAERQYMYQKKIDSSLEATKNINNSFLSDQWTRLLRAAALDFSEMFGAMLDHTTVEIIRSALGKDYILALDPTDKKTIRIIKKELKESFDFRVNRLARTESTTISALGNEIGARSWMSEQGGQGYRMWFGRIVNERPTHLETNDTIIKVEDFYLVGGETCKRPGDYVLSPKERINCRCSESFMTENRYNQYVKRGMIKDGKVVQDYD